MTIFSCPVCGAPLIESERAYICPERHSFDIAREGYVNLLLARGKPPKFPGDSKSMLLARRAFLERGHYQPLSDAINTAVTSYIGDHQGEDYFIADIGAGEGWYVGQLAAHLAANEKANVRCYGLDISKDAMRMAAKRYGNITFAVADVWDRLPFADASVHVLLNVFAPRNIAEFARVLAPGGHAIIAIPGEAHLAELRGEIPMIGIEPDKQSQTINMFAHIFVLCGQESVGFTMELSGNDVCNLAMMTPNARHIIPEMLARLQEVSMKVTASFMVLEFEKLP